eukprot:TRINITY_DN31173_c0_g1_i1.p1 TRINITY_DN31173_c0_g1~~TRINITY_DN31173_c0_g1_i1.p1  ORF type:complete len:994 (+),score=236.65 TRINITY_DN31173_c0_g1_i1:44-3025(+)
MGETIRIGLVGKEWPCREGKAIPGTVVTIPKDEPLEKSSKELCEALGVQNLDGITLSRNAVRLPDYDPADEIVVSSSPADLGFGKQGIIVVTKKAADAAPAATTPEPAAAAPAEPAPKTEPEELTKFGFVGESWPCQEGRAAPSVMLSVDRNQPIVKSSSEIASALSITSLSEVSLHRNAVKLPDYEPGDEIDINSSPGDLGFKNIALICVVKKPAGGTEASPPPEPAAEVPKPTPVEPPPAPTQQVEAAPPPQPPPPATPANPPPVEASPTPVPVPAAAVPVPTPMSPPPIMTPVAGVVPYSSPPAGSPPPYASSPSLQVISPDASIPQSQAELARLVALQRSELTRLRCELNERRKLDNTPQSEAERIRNDRNAGRQLFEQMNRGKRHGEQLLVTCDVLGDLNGVYSICGVCEGKPMWKSGNNYLKSLKGYWVVTDKPRGTSSGVMRSAVQHRNTLPQEHQQHGWKVADVLSGSWVPSYSTVEGIASTGTTGIALDHVNQRNQELEELLAESLRKAAPSAYLVTCPEHPLVEGVYRLSSEVSNPPTLLTWHSDTNSAVLYTEGEGVWKITTSGMIGVHDGTFVVTSDPNVKSSLPDECFQWLCQIDEHSDLVPTKMTVVKHDDLAPQQLQSLAVSGMIREVGDHLLREYYFKLCRFSSNTKLQHKWAVRLPTAARDFLIGTFRDTSDTLLLRVYFHKLFQRVKGKQVAQQAVTGDDGQQAESQVKYRDRELGQIVRESVRRAGSPEKEIDVNAKDAWSVGSPVSSPSPRYQNRAFGGVPSSVLPPPPVHLRTPLQYSFESSFHTVPAAGVAASPSTALVQKGASSPERIASRYPSSTSTEQLWVYCPTLPNMSGCYVASGTRNGWPVWKKSRKCVLYSTSDVHNWMITDVPGTEDMNRGWIRSRGPHKGKHPLQIAEWEAWSGYGWSHDSTIKVANVTSLHFSTHCSQCGSEVVGWECRHCGNRIGSNLPPQQQTDQQLLIGGPWLAPAKV